MGDQIRSRNQYFMNRLYLIYTLILLLGSGLFTPARAQDVGQSPAAVSKVWVSDQGNGTYKNPVLYADYSDPDAVRVGDDFYMVSSSFADLNSINATATITSLRRREGWPPAGSWCCGLKTCMALTSAKW
jgi:hypothetical protein